MKNKILAFIAIAAAALILSFSPLSFPNSHDKKELSVAAASDLRFSFTEIAESFEKEKNAKVILVFGSSGTLAAQIEKGAPYDLFFSANREYVEELKSEGMLEASFVGSYAKGFIVLAKKKNSSAELNDLEDLAKPEVKIIALANPEHAPYGRAAVEALKNRKIWAKVREKIVYAENIAQAEEYVSTGNADAAIIALSLAINNADLTYVSIDPELYSPIAQYFGAIKNSKNKEIAQEFLEYLKSEKAKEVMRKYGYEHL